MADRMRFIGWGTPVRGSEARGLEVFNEALGLMGRMQQEGRIEALRPWTRMSFANTSTPPRPALPACSCAAGRGALCN